MLRLRTPLFFALLIGASMLLSACAGSGRLRYETPQEAYEKGLALFEKGDYDKAAEYLQGTFDFGRTHQWAADAQLLLARSYRANEDYLLAANEFTRFTQIYRSDERVPDAEYELALTYYDRSPKYQLDQSDTERAIVQFQLFITRYRDNPLIEDAQARITELRGKLAQKQIHTAELYATRGYHNAAAVSYEAAFDRFYDTEMADDALLGALRSYYEYAKASIRNRQMERLEMAESNYDRLIQIFPNSPLMKEAESIYVEVQAMMNSLQTTS
ncbi:MAG: outer membrane protein assembly factor BamD [Bacteroidetes bacterium]|nr:outer membrane protein assembly factor BamD [Bacteroidota bacterium]MDA1332618.1 outer membrane protein assembly factor BamD [Bacteroidota bacterium]